MLAFVPWSTWSALHYWSHSRHLKIQPVARDISLDSEHVWQSHTRFGSMWSTEGKSEIWKKRSKHIHGNLHWMTPFNNLQSKMFTERFPALPAWVFGWHKYTSLPKSSRALGTNSTNHFESSIWLPVRNTQRQRMQAASPFSPTTKQHLYCLYSSQYQKHPHSH